jgi:CO dehydrogenase/acetyl-CoA synthase beta subunit
MPVATFDPYVRKVADWVERRSRRGGVIREFDAREARGALLDALPEPAEPAGGAGIVLKRETFVELGSPRAGSCAFPLLTSDPSLVRDGRITLIGPGIQASPGASLPFGQVLLAAGPALTDADFAELEQAQYLAARIEGYMIRSTPGRMWSRVSRRAAEAGFDFELLGRALIGGLKSRLPGIEALQVLFVTSSREELRELEEIAEQVRTIGRHVASETWRARGIDLECSLGVDCKSCDDKPACDDIRDVVRIRKRRADA